MADNASIGTMIIQIIIVILGLVGLYYLYQYLFSSTTASVALITGKKDATTYGTGLVVPGASIPPIYLGGTFSVSTWININNFGFHSGINKSILRIGGDNYDTLRIYLGPTASQLMVRFDTHQGASDTANKLAKNDGTFSTNSTNFVPQTIATMPMSSGGSNACDVLQIDLQRWVHIVVAVNGTMCDLYIDGKLARSCVLNNYFNVDTGYKAHILDNGGFGGFISTTTMYAQALSPDLVYQIYMATPEPITNFVSYLASFFSPTAAY